MSQTVLKSLLIPLFFPLHFSPVWKLSIISKIFVMLLNPLREAQLFKDRWPSGSVVIEESLLLLTSKQGNMKLSRFPSMENSRTSAHLPRSIWCFKGGFSTWYSRHNRVYFIFLLHFSILVSFALVFFPPTPWSNCDLFYLCNLLSSVLVFK